MPLILGTNSIKDTGYDVDNSCRFDDGSSCQMRRAGVDGGDQDKFTLSMWIKRGVITTNFPRLFTSKASNDDRFEIYFGSDDSLYIEGRDNGTATLNLNTNRKFRDPSAWFHFLLAVDTDQATASNRAKLYINGVQETSFATETYPAQDGNIGINTSSFPIRIGEEDGNGVDFDGYLTEIVYLDGVQKANTDFGEFDGDSPTIWKPKDVSDLSSEKGNNGFYLDFEDSSNLGNDVFGGTDFSVSNLSSIDQTTDTCTNNFCTINPLTSTQDFNLSEGNLKLGASSDNAVINGTLAGTIDNTNSGYYFEYKVNASNLGNNGEGFRMGIVNVDDIMLSPFTSARQLNVTNPALVYQTATNGGDNRTDTDIGSASNGDICMVAWKNGKVWLGVNGTFVNSGNPSAGSGEQFSGLSGEFIPFLMCSLTNGVNGAQFNFGNPSFSISSGNADANGFGNFEFAPPTGFFALCTKNIAEIG
jgi:hypothetical protein